MPFLPFVALLAWQAFSKSATFALGWATAIYFGQVPGRQGRILAVISLASAAWVILVVGFAVPLLAGAALDAVGLISRNFTVEPIHALGLGAAVVLGPPVMAAATVWGGFHGDQSLGGWLRIGLIGYPGAASLGLGVIQMVIFTPFLVVQRLLRKQALLQTALAMREEADDDDLTDAVAHALRSLGIERVEAGEVRGVLAWPMRTVAFSARHLISAVVRGDPMHLRANGLRIYAYATNVAIIGPSEEAYRARAAIQRELPFRNARLSWSENARELEDELMATYRDHPNDLGALHASLDEIQARIDATSVTVDEWNLLYRLRLQVEHAVAEGEQSGASVGTQGERRKGDGAQDDGGRDRRRREERAAAGSRG